MTVEVACDGVRGSPRPAISFNVKRYRKSNCHVLQIAAKHQFRPSWRLGMIYMIATASETRHGAFALNLNLNLNRSKNEIATCWERHRLANKGSPFFVLFLAFVTGDGIVYMHMVTCLARRDMMVPGCPRNTWLGKESWNCLFVQAVLCCSASLVQSMCVFVPLSCCM